MCLLLVGFLPGVARTPLSRAVWVVVAIAGYGAYIFGGAAIPDAVVKESSWVLVSAAAGGLLGGIAILTQRDSTFLLGSAFNRFGRGVTIVLPLAGAGSATAGLLVGVACGRAVAWQDTTFSHRFAGNIPDLLPAMLAGLTTALLIVLIAATIGGRVASALGRARRIHSA